MSTASGLKGGLDAGSEIDSTADFSTATSARGEHRDKGAGKTASSWSGETIGERRPDGQCRTVAGFVDFYLDEAHRDARSNGCTVAALAGDAARKSPDVQTQFRRQIESNLEILGEALNRSGAPEPRETALLLLSTLYGALMMARAVGDVALVTRSPAQPCASERRRWRALPRSPEQEREDGKK